MMKELFQDKAGDAIKSGDPDKIGLLLFNGARLGRVDTVERAIAANADVNWTNVDGFTPLIAAARFGHANCLLRLLEAKADLSRATSAGLTAFSLANQFKHVSCISLLTEAALARDELSGLLPKSNPIVTSNPDATPSLEHKVVKTGKLFESSTALSSSSSSNNSNNETLRTLDNAASSGTLASSLVSSSTTK